MTLKSLDVNARCWLALRGLCGDEEGAVITWPGIFKVHRWVLWKMLAWRLVAGLSAWARRP